MGIVLAFPERPRPMLRPFAGERPGEVVILPVVRIERMADKPRKAKAISRAAPRRKRRRAQRAS